MIDAGKYDELREDYHKMEIAIVQMQSDIKVIKESQTTLNTNISRVLFIIGGGFILAAVGFITRGGLGT